MAAPASPELDQRGLSDRDVRTRRALGPLILLGATSRARGA